MWRLQDTCRTPESLDTIGLKPRNTACTDDPLECVLFQQRKPKSWPVNVMGGESEGNAADISLSHVMTYQVTDLQPPTLRLIIGIQETVSVELVLLPQVVSQSHFWHHPASRQTMGKTALKLDSPADGISMGSTKKNPSPRAKGRPRKSLMRQHRKESLRAELADEPMSPQAESPLLKPAEDGPQQPGTASSNNDDKPSRRAIKLPSTSLHRSKRAEKGNNNDDKNENADTNQKEQSPVSTARRSGIMSWRSRNFTASIVEDAPPASCPLSCQPSACFIGSLNGTISEMHLPLLTKQTKARVNALKADPKQRQLEVTIERSDELPFGAYSHPQVRVHIVDRCTGRAICPAQMTSEAKFCVASDNNANYTSEFCAGL